MQSLMNNKKFNKNQKNQSIYLDSSRMDNDQKDKAIELALQHHQIKPNSKINFQNYDEKVNINIDNKIKVVRIQKDRKGKSLQVKNIVG